MITLVVGQLLVWALGAACVAALVRAPTPSRNALVLGYGYPVGTVALTLWMRALSLVNVSWGWLTVGLPLLGATALIAWKMKRDNVRLLDPVRWTPDDVSLAGFTSRGARVVWWVLLALIGLHLLFGFLEILWRPLFPWDAWTQWATKARVWYETLHMAPFVETAAWLAGATAYTDAVPGYPANLPLLQVWACITIGRWDDSLMNLPSLLFAMSLALGFHGQLRLAGRPAILGVAAAYAAVSLPLLDTHVALSGYADFPLSVYFSLAAIALWQWTTTRDRSQLVLALILAIACPLTKYPGWAWIAVLMMGMVVARFPRRGIWIAVTGVVVAIFGMAVVSHSDLTIGGYRMGTFHPVWEPLWQNYFQFANWHLVWYLLPVLVVLNRRRLLERELIAGTAMVLGGLAFLFVAFTFSNAAAFVTDYSTVNRATLHLAPLLVYYLAQLAYLALNANGHVSTAGSPMPPTQPTPAAVDREPAPTVTAA